MAARNTFAGSCRGVSLEITTFDTTNPRLNAQVGEVLEHVALPRPEATTDEHPTRRRAGRRRFDGVEELAEAVLHPDLEGAEDHHRVAVGDAGPQGLERPAPLDPDLGRSGHWSSIQS